MLRTLVLILLLLPTLTACFDRWALAESSFGTAPSAKASPASVISMGRDDDDGKAKKWHIGGKD